MSRTKNVKKHSLLALGNAVKWERHHFVQRFRLLLRTENEYILGEQPSGSSGRIAYITA